MVEPQFNFGKYHKKTPETNNKKKPQAAYTEQ